MTVQSTGRAIAVVLLLGWSASSANAQTPGTYQLRGGNYAITVAVEGDALVVTEPNRVSRYTQTSPGTYRTYNESLGAHFYLRVVSAGTLEAWRDPSSGSHSLLDLTSASAEAASTDRNRYLALADRYRLLAEGDIDNVQAWTFCAASARAYADRTRDEANEYARQAAAQLKQILTDPSRNPCADAIPAGMWDGGAATQGTAADAAPHDGAPPSGLPATAAEQLGQAIANEGAAQFATAASDFISELGTGNQLQAPPQLTPEQERIVVAAGNALVEWFEERQARRLAEVQAMAQRRGDEITAFNEIFTAAMADYPRAIEMRNQRLASGIFDVVGFSVPIRPAPDEIVLDELGARVLGHGVVGLPHLSFQDGFYESAEGLRPNQVSMPGGGVVDLPEGTDMRAAFEGISEAVVMPSIVPVVDYTIHFAVAERGSVQIRCTHYAPDGSVIETTEGRARVGRGQEELIWHSRVHRQGGWEPGIYGIECATEDEPFLNTTFDIY